MASTLLQSWVVAVQIASDTVQLELTVDPKGTCVSSLSFSLALAQGTGNAGFTPNMLSTSGSCVQPFSGTYLATSNSLYSPVGGTVSFSNATYASITGISLASANGSVATETWSIGVLGNAVVWTVQRSYTASGTALGDQSPALWVQTTTIAYDEEGEGGERTPLSAERARRESIPSSPDPDPLLPGPGCGPPR